MTFKDKIQNRPTIHLRMSILFFVTIFPTLQTMINYCFALNNLDHKYTELYMFKT